MRCPCIAGGLFWPVEIEMFERFFVGDRCPEEAPYLDLALIEGSSVEGSVVVFSCEEAGEE